MSYSTCIKCESMVMRYEKYCFECETKYNLYQDDNFHRENTWGSYDPEEEFEKDKIKENPDQQKLDLDDKK